jgi:hypothetical protein
VTTLDPGLLYAPRKQVAYVYAAWHALTLQQQTIVSMRFTYKASGSSGFPVNLAPTPVGSMGMVSGTFSVLLMVYQTHILTPLGPG